MEQILEFIAAIFTALAIACLAGVVGMIVVSAYKVMVEEE